LHILSLVAESERGNIKKRQEQGIIAAKEKGVVFGRPELALPDDFPKIIKDWERRKITTEQAIKKCGISRSTFYRRVREYKLSYKKAQ